MSDYTIVGWSAVKRVLELVQPFSVFKREQVARALELVSRFGTTLTPGEFLEFATLVDAFATLNYSKHKHLDARCVREFLEGKGLLVPVTTEALDAEIVCDCPSNTRVANPSRDHTPAPGNRMKI